MQSALLLWLFVGVYMCGNAAVCPGCCDVHGHDHGSVVGRTGVVICQSAGLLPSIPSFTVTPCTDLSAHNTFGQGPARKGGSKNYQVVAIRGRGGYVGDMALFSVEELEPGLQRSASHCFVVLLRIFDTGNGIAKCYRSFFRPKSEQTPPPSQ